MSIPVTFRISPEDLERLNALTRLTGKPRSQVLRENLGLAERLERETYGHGWRVGFKEGAERGRTEGLAAGRNTLRTACPGCNKPMIFDLKADDWRYWRALVRMDSIKGYRCVSCRQLFTPFR